MMTRAMTHYTPSKRELDKHRMKSLVAMATQEADARRAAGPTGETLAEAERRIAIASRQSRDIDPADVRKRPAMGRRGGW